MQYLSVFSLSLIKHTFTLCFFIIIIIFIFGNTPFCTEAVKLILNTLFYVDLFLDGKEELGTVQVWVHFRCFFLTFMLYC